jgi:hypothetical protein
MSLPAFLNDDIDDYFFLDWEDAEMWPEEIWDDDDYYDAPYYDSDLYDIEYDRP